VSGGFHPVSATGAHPPQVFILLLLAEVVKDQQDIKHLLKGEHLEHFGCSVEAVVDLLPCHRIKLIWAKDTLGEEERSGFLFLCGESNNRARLGSNLFFSHKKNNRFQWKSTLS
jgi:hypothetical protein